jgi:hypothetical protein
MATENGGAVYSPRTTRSANEDAPARTTYTVTPASSRPPRQPQPGMDSAANIDALAEQ